MQIRELLVEYNRQVTANQVGTRVLLAVAKDSGYLPDELLTIHTRLQLLSQLQGADAHRRLDSVIKPEHQQAWVQAVLAAIEAKDPTPNKAYTPWLAKMYAKGGLRIEDMNRHNFLAIFDLGKRRRMIRPEHADINRFKSYQDFENVMWMEYDHSELEGKTADEFADSKATTFYKDKDVTVIIPLNQSAACKYGRGTRWCTAATRGENYYNYYARSGPLYIIIPKKPKHEGEKYQLHFQRREYRDETDEMVDLVDLLMYRFPQLKEPFTKEFPNLLSDVLAFVPDHIVKEAMQKVYEYMTTKRKIKFYLSEIAHNDEDFLAWGRDSNKFDDSKSWVENYLIFKPDAEAELKQELKKLQISKQTLIDEAGNVEYGHPRIRDIPELIYEHIFQEGVYDDYLGGYAIMSTLRDVGVRLEGDTVYVEQRDWSDNY